MSTADCSALQFTDGGHSLTLDLDFSPDSSTLITCGADNQFKIWLVPGMTEDDGQSHSNNVYQCRYSYDGWIYVGSDNGNVDLYNPNYDLSSTYVTNPSGGRITSLSVHPSSREAVFSKSTDYLFRSTVTNTHIYQGLNMRVAFSENYFANS